MNIWTHADPIAIVGDDEDLEIGSKAHWKSGTQSPMKVESAADEASEQLLKELYKDLETGSKIHWKSNTQSLIRKESAADEASKLLLKELYDRYEQRQSHNE